MKPSERVCRSVEWYTPPYILEMVKDVFGALRIDLDPCTVESNPTEAKYIYTAAEDGLSKDWGLGPLKNCFVNPPYGEQLGDWIEKTVSEAEQNPQAPFALLLAASSRWEQPYWWRIFSPHCDAMFLFRKRIRYLRGDTGGEGKAPNYPSIMFFYNISVPHAERVISVSGKLIPLSVAT